MTMKPGSIAIVGMGVTTQGRALGVTEVFGPGGPTKLYCGELHGVGRLYSC